MILFFDYKQQQNIGKSVLQGFVDSIRGTAVVFYLDREVNKKLQINSQENDAVASSTLLATTTTSNNQRSSFKKQDNTKRAE